MRYTPIEISERLIASHVAEDVVPKGGARDKETQERGQVIVKQIASRPLRPATTTYAAFLGRQGRLGRWLSGSSVTLRWARSRILFDGLGGRVMPPSATSWRSLVFPAPRYDAENFRHRGCTGGIRCGHSGRHRPGGKDDGARQGQNPTPIKVILQHREESEALYRGCCARIPLRHHWSI